MRLWHGLEIDFPRRQLAFRPHFLPSGRQKCDLGDLEEAMFEGVNWPRQIIFGLLASSK
jgi:hypothetical protein